MKLSPHQQLELLAETPTGKWLVTEEGEFEKAGLLRSILEQVKGWLGYGDRTSPVALEYAFIRLLEKGCEEDIFTAKDIQLIDKGARNAGLITGKEIDPKKHAELAHEIELIRQHVLKKAPLDTTSLQNSTFDYYTAHAKQLMHILPVPNPPAAKITKATQDILVPETALPKTLPATTVPGTVLEKPETSDSSVEVTPVTAPIPPVSDKKITVISPRPHNPSVDLWLKDLREKNINWNAGGRLPLDNCYRRLCRQARPQSKDADLLDACVEQLLLTAEGFEAREYKKKALLLDRLDEHLGFSNALAVLAAGYQLAHHLKTVGNLFERAEAANALALFRDKLVELTEKYPDAYAKAKLTSRFDKKAVPKTFIQELIKAAAAEQKRSLITNVAMGTFVALGALAAGAYFRSASSAIAVPTIPAPDYHATVYGPVNAPTSIPALPKSALEPQPQTPWQNAFESDLYGMSYPNTTSTTPPPANIPKVPETDAKITLPPGWKNPFSNVSDWFGAPHSNATSTLSTSPPANTIPDDAEETLQPGRQNPFVEDIETPRSNATDKLTALPSAEVQKESLQNPEANTSTRFDKKLPINWLNRDPFSTTSTNVTPPTTIPNPSYTLPDEKISLINTLALSLIGMVGGMVGAVSYYLFPKTSPAHPQPAPNLSELEKSSPVSAAQASPSESIPAPIDVPESNNAVSPSSANLEVQQPAREDALQQISSPSESLPATIDVPQPSNAVSTSTTNLGEQLQAQQAQQTQLVIRLHADQFSLASVTAMQMSRKSSTTEFSTQETQASAATITEQDTKTIPSVAPPIQKPQPMTQEQATQAASEVATPFQKTQPVSSTTTTSTSLQRPATNSTLAPAAEEPGDDSLNVAEVKMVPAPQPIMVASFFDIPNDKLAEIGPLKTAEFKMESPTDNKVEQNVMSRSTLGPNKVQKLSASLSGSTEKNSRPQDVISGDLESIQHKLVDQRAAITTAVPPQLSENDSLSVPEMIPAPPPKMVASANAVQNLSSSFRDFEKIPSTHDNISRDLEKFATQILDQSVAIAFCNQIKTEWGAQFFSPAGLRNNQLDLIAEKLKRIPLTPTLTPQQAQSRALASPKKRIVSQEEMPNAIVKLISHLIPLVLYPPLMENGVALNTISMSTLLNCLDQLAIDTVSVIDKIDSRFFFDDQMKATQKIYMLSHLNFADVNTLNKIQGDGLYKMLLELRPPSLSKFLMNTRIHVPQTYRQTCIATAYNLFIQRHCGTIVEMLVLAKETIRKITEKLDTNENLDEPAFEVTSGQSPTKRVFVTGVLSEATRIIDDINKRTLEILNDSNSDPDPLQIAALTREWNFVMQYIATVLNPQEPRIYSYQYLPDNYYVSAAIAAIKSKIAQLIPGQPTDAERWKAISQSDLQDLTKTFFGNLNNKYVYRHGGMSKTEGSLKGEITRDDIWNRVYVENGGFLNFLSGYTGHMMFVVAEINEQGEKVVDLYDPMSPQATPYSIEAFDKLLNEKYEKYGKNQVTNSLYTYQRSN